MRFLLDEQLHEDAAAALDALGRRKGDSFVHIYDLDAIGTQDPDIPALCRGNEVEVLISANVRDFGAKLALYKSLLEEDVSVIVLRPGKQRLLVETQVSIVSQHLNHTRVLLNEDEEPCLIKLTPSGVEKSRLADLIAEVEERQEARRGADR